MFLIKGNTMLFKTEGFFATIVNNVNTESLRNHLLFTKQYFVELVCGTRYLYISFCGMSSPVPLNLMY